MNNLFGPLSSGRGIPGLGGNNDFTQGSITGMRGLAGGQPQLPMVGQLGAPLNPALANMLPQGRQVQMPLQTMDELGGEPTEEGFDWQSLLPLLGGAAGALDAVHFNRRVDNRGKVLKKVAGKYGLAEGGLAGYFAGGTKGQDDKIPAMLSDGEFVFDADTVAALGDGNNAAGASALEQMRQNIRKHKRGAPKDKIPPKAKAPEAYLKGRK